MSDIYRFVIPWIITLLVYLFVQIGVFNRRLISSLFFRKSLLLIFVFQVATIFFTTFQVGDVMLFSDAGYYFRNGVDYYWIDSNHTQYPFFPFLIFFHAVANKLTYIFSFVNFVQILKLILLAALYMIARFIYKNTNLTLLEKRRRVCSFLLNPITYSVVLFHGQIDVILIALLIYASHSLQRAKTLVEIIIAGLLFAASVATKTWSVIFLPLYLKFFGFRNTFIVGITTLLFLLIDVFIYTRMVFGSAFRVVLPAILNPGGPVGIWGFSYIFRPWSELITQYNLPIFGCLISLGFLFIFFKKIPFWEASTLLILWVYLIIPNWGIQYLFWVIPFSYLRYRTRRWIIYDTVGGIYLLINYVNVIKNEALLNNEIIASLGIILWIIVLLLFIIPLKGSSK